MLISSDSCATPTPSSAGSISVSTWRTPGSCQAMRRRRQVRPMRGSSPRFLSAGTCTASCRMPPSITPAAMAKIGSMPSRPNHGAPHQAAAIIDRFSSTGVAAGTAKCRQVLRMPADSATSDMQAM